MSDKPPEQPNEKPMAIAHAPRLEVVLSPEGPARAEGEEIDDGTLFNAYLIMHQLDGTVANFRLDAGPFTYDEGVNFIAAVCTTVGEMRGATPSADLDAKFRKLAKFRKH
jgi:hypothetical protein